MDNAINTLSNEDLLRHVRSAELNARHTWSRESQKYAEVLDAALAEQRRRYEAQTPTTYDRVGVETNHGHFVLVNATWTPYTSGSYADGRNGVLEGLCESGGETSRLFHAVSHRNDAGKVKRFEYAHLSKVWPGYEREDGTRVLSCFHLTSCG